jgi:uncharacterized protein YyaL (SSP411 family)
MANRLIDEDSPYLQQHANNPVEWYPWCDEAFAKAKEENKLIFLSIGYSSCHWCHVMEKESFENEEIAEYLNSNYICIKVDREERPDIDKHFQLVYQVINRRAGGWPLSVFMSPSAQTFYAGTYYPPTTSLGTMGFKELTNLLYKKFEISASDIDHNANVLDGMVKKIDIKKDETKLGIDHINLFMHDVKKNYEEEFGGFSNAPKFPHHSTLNSLINISKLTKADDAKDMLQNTLSNMTKGGMYDLIDGGFCRYSVDDRWLVPHFEKMCYDNALLIETYIKAYHHTNNKEYKDTAIDIAEFMYQKMSEESLFYSASDADSNGVEGAYFVYDFDEIEKLFVENSIDRELLAKIGFSLDGNFEGENIVRVDEEFEEFDTIKKLLKTIRDDREYPFIDKKIITAQNAMMIKSLFILGRSEPKYIQKAKESLEKLMNSMYINNELKHTKIADNSAKIDGFLDDYAYLALALLEGYKSTLDDDYIITAQKLINDAISKYYENGKWYYSIADFKTTADSTDGSTPSAISAICDATLTLSTILHDMKYKEIVYNSINYYSGDIKLYPYAHSYFSDIVTRYYSEDKLISSNIENLHEIVLKIDSYEYPYVYLKVTDESNYTICKNGACLNNLDNIEMIKI